MKRTRLLRVSLGLACVAALAVPAGGQAAQSNAKGENNRSLYATDNQGNLVSFSADHPRKLGSSTPITGLGTGVTLTGIDFRPATGELYGVGSDSIVYRVSPVDGEGGRRGPGVHAHAERPLLRRRLQPNRGSHPGDERREPEPAAGSRHRCAGWRRCAMKTQRSDRCGLGLHELVVQRHAARGDGAVRARCARRRDLRAEPAEQRHAHDAAAVEHQRSR